MFPVWWGRERGRGSVAVSGALPLRQATGQPLSHAFLPNLRWCSSSRKSRRLTLPVVVVGSSWINSISRRYSWADSHVRTYSASSRASAGVGRTPSRSCTKALTTSPRTASGLPTAAATATAECPAKQSSISPGPMHAIATTRDDVILTANEPVIAVLVFACQVTSQGPRPDEFFRSRCWVMPIAQEHHRIRPSDGDLPGITHWHRLAGLVNDIHGVAGNGTSHGTRPYRHQHGTIAQPAGKRVSPIISSFRPNQRQTAS